MNNFQAKLGGMDLFKEGEKGLGKKKKVEGPAMTINPDRVDSGQYLPFLGSSFFFPGCKPFLESSMTTYELNRQKK